MRHINSITNNGISKITVKSTHYRHIVTNAGCQDLGIWNGEWSRVGGFVQSEVKMGYSMLSVCQDSKQYVCGRVWRGGQLT